MDVAYDHDPSIDGFAVAACSADLGKGNPTTPHRTVGNWLLIDKPALHIHTVAVVVVVPIRTNISSTPQQAQRRKAADVDIERENPRRVVEGRYMIGPGPASSTQ